MWLWGIARRQVALQFRKRRGERVRARGGQEGPAEAAAQAEEAAAVRAVLASLPDGYAFALAAKYFEGLPTAGLAAAMGVSEVAAESLLARARGAFRAAYGKRAMLAEVPDGQR
jgi:RNA polymerase sigma-70 factor (ECF subfamily)